MLKIYTVCGAGVGSSMMLKVFTQQILSKENIEARVDATDIGSIDPKGADIIITTSDFANVLRNSEAQIIKIDNLTDKEYLKSQLMEVIGKLEK
ncbi:PTS sugar transporter subunit IIB [Maledivibacter halophilus]|uniref:PTS system, ascorbate-specific IIB component n=1 Tax=Maledivibacter halophilus TaxID=36842 RepID=A0A1T5M9F0_9FIRM|nr:PTS sugar transporter subunit IIB [Maledivibacter halophilus]SKC84860.1 PTS system, ascorbate-specific IIB component [Maledivibacter halophilus]